MAAPVTLIVREYNGDRTLTWARADRDDTHDEGAWSGDPQWVEAADSALNLRIPVLIAPPGLYYEFSSHDGTVTVADVAAAMIAAAGDRGDCADVAGELPSELFDDDAPEGAIN